MNRKKILFLTGTRADYGKMKPLMMAIENHPDYECFIFVTGMHTLSEFGDTRSEVIKDGYAHIHVYMNQLIEEPMDLALANTINGFSRYVRELKPDMIIVHGDRVETLAGAIVGALNNIRVSHIEGGELSGAIDESIRHSVSKLAHIHFVSNKEARDRLVQLGEQEDSIYIIGSPDIDIIMKTPSVSIDKIKQHYEIDFNKFAVLMYHPVTTDIDNLKSKIQAVVSAIIESGDNFIVINPNNDCGHKVILDEYKRFYDNCKIRCFPSIRFEYFIEIIRNSMYLIGNSSAGIHEVPVLGIPSVNIGTRQKNRFAHDSIIHCAENEYEILCSIQKAKAMKNIEKTTHFGNGNSRELFMEAIQGQQIWATPRQKVFNDL